MNKKLLFLVLYLFLVPFVTLCVTLTWNNSSNSTGYKLYYGPKSGGPYPNSIVSGSNTAKVDSIFPYQIAYFTVTATNALGEESLYSNEVSYTNTLRVTIKLQSSTNLIDWNSESVSNYYQFPSSVSMYYRVFLDIKK